MKKVGFVCAMFITCQKLLTQQNLLIAKLGAYDLQKAIERKDNELVSLLRRAE